MAAPRKRPAAGRSARPARSTSSRKAASPARGSSRRQKDDDEEPAEEGGIGWEGGVGIVTFLILLAAIVILDRDLGTKYPDEGIFFSVQDDAGSSSTTTTE